MLTFFASIIAITNLCGTVSVDTHGARVVSYVPVGGGDLFFVSKTGTGGMPLCWPWFAGCGPDAGSRRHGLARYHDFKVVSLKRHAPWNTELTLRLDSNAETRRAFPHDFALTVSVRLTDRLTVSMTGENTGDAPFRVTEAFLPYFAVADSEKCRTEGLDSQQGRLADVAGGLELSLSSEGGGYRVWRPNADSPLLSLVSSMEPGDWRRFLCVGNGTFSKEAAYSLAPGGRHTLAFTIRLASTHAAARPIELQSRIDAVAASGGGRVDVPPGEWLSRAIRLRSNVELHLSEGATLVFSDDPADCLPEVQTSFSAMEYCGLSPLVYAFGATNVSITGRGTIAPRMALWREWFLRDTPEVFESQRLLYEWGENDVPVEKRRFKDPRAARIRPCCIEFDRCRGVRLEGFRIRESPLWCVHLRLCNGAVVRGIDIKARGHNNDGIDINASRNVLIENCTLDQGDDGFVIKSGRDRDGRRIGVPCENVEIRNCMTRSGHTLLAVGSEVAGGVRNIFLHDCRVEGRVRCVVNIKTNDRKGSFVEDVVVSNITVRGSVENVVGLRMDAGYQWDSYPTRERLLTRIEDIRIEGIEADSVGRICNMVGDPRLPPKNIVIRNVTANSFCEESEVEYIDFADDGTAQNFARHQADELFREPLGKTVFSDEFNAPSVWKTENYNDRLDVRIGGRAPGDDGVLYIAGTTNRKDSAWCCAMAAPRPLERKAKAYIFSVEARTTVEIFHSTQSGKWSSSINWFDAKGKRISTEALNFKVGIADDFLRLYAVGRIPVNAASYSLQLGFDLPDVKPGNLIAFRRPVLAVTDATWAIRRCRRFALPRVKVLTPSPTRDAKSVLKVSITGDTPIAGELVRIVVDGRDETANFTRSGDVWTLGGGREWTSGIHHIDVTAADWYGCGRTYRKFLFIGDPPGSGTVTIREDGKFVANGKPFFPIGVYAVGKREFNGYDLDKAFRMLKAGGLNTVHSYGARGTNEEFLACARSNGMMAWTAYRSEWDVVAMPGEDFANRLRHDPTTLAWYLGDDTSRHQSPEELIDYNDAVKAFDPNHPTAQADGLHMERPVDNYCAYVEGTDIFIPEIYPIHTASTNSDPNCVAIVISNMIRCRADAAKFGKGKVKAIMPVLQHFKGWGNWPRFPNPDEAMAMAFAAVVQGAGGVLWYTYGGTGRNQGVTSTPERWAATTNMATRLKEISPALLSSTIAISLPEIVGGPVKDTCGNPSLSVLAKRYGGAVWIIAVNSCYDRVDARITAPEGEEDAEVLWENRKVQVRDGRFDDSFAPFAVHVYRFPSRARGQEPEECSHE